MNATKKIETINPAPLFLGWLAFNTLVFAALAGLLPASAAASGNPVVMLFALPAAWKAVARLTTGVMLISGLGLLLVRRKAVRADRTAAGQDPGARSQPNGG